MSYVDGFLLPVPKNKLSQYMAIAKKAGKIWKEHGALDYKECVGEDLKIKGVTPFTKVLKTSSKETVIFAYIVFKSRKHRDTVNKKVMSDPRLQNMSPDDMPFDMRRMCVGGFKVIVDPK